MLLASGTKSDLVMNLELADRLDLCWKLQGAKDADHPGGDELLHDVDVPLELHVLETNSKGLAELKGLGSTAQQLDDHQCVGCKDVLSPGKLGNAVVQHLLVLHLHRGAGGNVLDERGVPDLGGSGQLDLELNGLGGGDGWVVNNSVLVEPEGRLAVDLERCLRSQEHHCNERIVPETRFYSKMYIFHTCSSSVS